MQQLLGHKKDAILVVPYVAIVQEKVGHYELVGNTCFFDQAIPRC